MNAGQTDRASDAREQTTGELHPSRGLDRFPGGAEPLTSAATRRRSAAVGKFVGEFAVSVLILGVFFAGGHALLNGGDFTVSEVLTRGVVMATVYGVSNALFERWRRRHPRPKT